MRHDSRHCFELYEGDVLVSVQHPYKQAPLKLSCQQLYCNVITNGCTEEHYELLDMVIVYCNYHKN